MRAGDVWVVGSQTYKSLEERLISHEDLKLLTKANALQISVTSDFDVFLKDCQILLNMRVCFMMVSLCPPMLQKCAFGYRWLNRQQGELCVF